MALWKSLALAVQVVSEVGTSASSPIATFVAAVAASACLRFNEVLWLQWGLVNVPSGVQSKSNTACYKITQILFGLFSQRSHDISYEISLTAVICLTL